MATRACHLWICPIYSFIQYVCTVTLDCEKGQVNKNKVNKIIVGLHTL